MHAFASPTARLAAATAALLAVPALSPAFAGTGEDLLSRSAEHYAGLEAYGATMTIHFELPEAYKAAGNMEPSVYRAIVARDGRIALRPGGGIITDLFVQDADRWYTELAFFKMYILDGAVPADRLLEGERGIRIPGGAELVRMRLRSGEAGSYFSLGTLEDRGGETLDGIPHHRLGIAGESFNGELWIPETGTPWIHRIRLTPAPQGGGVRPVIDLRFTDWNASPQLEDAFDFAANTEFEKRETWPGPEDLKKLQGQGGGHASLDKPAPGATLGTLDGGTMDLEALKGQVVVLDFWATWCGPCIRALPGVIEVTSELAGRGVAFYAVNLREPESKVRAFLEKKGWQMPVAMDPTGSTGQAFGVTGIPHTVIIDREGVIRQVKTGFAPGMEKQLKADIEDVLDR